MTDVYMRLAKIYAEHNSTCLRRKVGAILVDSKEHFGVGANHAPHKERCITCLRQELNIESGTRHELCHALHAEIDALLNAYDIGVEVKGSTLYVTTMPCSSCAKILLAAGVKTIYYQSDYNDPLSQEILASINLVKVD